MKLQWSTSRVTDMHIIFAETDNFDQDLGAWDVSAVTDMRYATVRSFLMCTAM
jgi:surface protein